MFGYVRGQGTPYFFIFIVMEKVRKLKLYDLVKIKGYDKANGIVVAYAVDDSGGKDIYCVVRDVIPCQLSGVMYNDDELEFISSNKTPTLPKPKFLLHQVVRKDVVERFGGVYKMDEGFCGIVPVVSPIYDMYYSYKNGSWMYTIHINGVELDYSEDSLISVS